MTHSDLIHLMDMKYSGDGAVQCPHEGTPVKSGNGKVYSTHGALGVHSSAAQLVCGRCGYNQPTSQV